MMRATRRARMKLVPTQNRKPGRLRRYKHTQASIMLMDRIHNDYR
jgi:hypothetical protein